MLASGILPYEYDFATPLVATEGNPLGISGIFLESAQWVQTAEHRNITSGVIAPGFPLYVHEDLPSEGPFEPKADGSTVNNLPANPLFVNHITNLRGSLELLFHGYSLDSDYTAEEHKSDWLRQSYPNSLSGAILGEYAHRDHTETGVLLDLPGELLGASGVFDIDYGEVIFNPYPFFAKARTVNARVTNPLTTTPGTLDIVMSPFFPNFQRTDGTMITLNGFDVAALPSGNFDYFNTQHISSGLIRANMHASNEQFSKISAGPVGEVIDKPFGISTLGPRFFFPSGHLTDGSRVFVTPLAGPLLSGVYAVSGTNVGISYALPSGEISIWPKNQYPTSDAVPRGAGHVEDNNGFEVFDDSLMFTDYGSQPPPLTTPAFEGLSGLLTVSPFTAKYLWLRNAELAESVTDFVEFSIPFTLTKGNYANQKGMTTTLIGGETKFLTFYKGYDNTVTDPTLLPVYECFFLQFDSLLNFESEIIKDITDPVDPDTQSQTQETSTSVSDFMYVQSLDRYLMFHDSWGDNSPPRSNDFVTILDSNLDQRYSWNGGPSSNKYFEGLGGDIFAYLVGSGIKEVTFSPTLPGLNGPPFGPGTFSVGNTSTEKPVLDFPAHPTSGVYDVGQIVDVASVLNQDSTVYGTWALCVGRLNKLTSFPLGGFDTSITIHRLDTLFLFKIEERSTFWEIVEKWDLGVLQHGVADDSLPGPPAYPSQISNGVPPISIVNGPVV